MEALRGKLTIPEAAGYVVVQIIGCCLGALLAHAMFEMPLIQTSLHLRTGPAQWLSEAVATAGLILVVIGSSGPNEAAWRVSAWIGAAYWFTASTSFANPAITIARSLSDTLPALRQLMCRHLSLPSWVERWRDYCSRNTFASDTARARSPFNSRSSRQRSGAHTLSLSSATAHGFRIHGTAPIRLICGKRA